MESAACDFPRGADRYCYRGGSRRMNPAMNSALNSGLNSTAGMAPVAIPYFFYGLAALAVVSGFLVITRRNVVHSALALIVTLLSVAGLYLVLYAPFCVGAET